ncbi:hypothetical protein ACFYXM_27920 [Streptomyces sp. NPDC002476]
MPCAVPTPWPTLCWPTLCWAARGGFGIGAMVGLGLIVALTTHFPVRSEK